MIRILLFAMAVVLAPNAAAADRVKNSIVSQLRAQGFTSIVVSRTLLGRSRVVAQSPKLDREIIYNPVTGEIIRDYWSERTGSQSDATLVDPNLSRHDDAKDASEEGDDGEGDDGEGDDGEGDDGEGDDGEGDDGEGDGEGDGDGDGESGDD